MSKLLLVFLAAGVSSYGAVSCTTNINMQNIYGDDVLFGPGNVAQGCLTSETGVDGFGLWEGDGMVSMAWKVSIVNNDANAPTLGDWVKYEYTLSVGDRSISHWILELSRDCTAACVQNLSASGTSEGPKLFTAGGASNPNMPDDLFGIKFEPSGSPRVMDVTFYSLRLPIWQNFYVKDGNNPTTDAYNRGFGLTNTLSYYVATPDTRELPEPGFYGLLSLGLAGIYYVSRRRKGVGQPE